MCVVCKSAFDGTKLFVEIIYIKNNDNYYYYKQLKKYNNNLTSVSVLNIWIFMNVEWWMFLLVFTD